MKIHSIFKSINGEICSRHQGSLTAFVRTFGCNSRCVYCDTPYSYEEGGAYLDMTVAQIVKEVLKLKVKNVTITGGEPLLQKGTINLIKELRFNDMNVSIETNGSKPIPSMDFGVSWVVDYKLPASGAEHLMKINHYKNLTKNDFVKFVVSDRADFEKALEIILSILVVVDRHSKPKFAFSPVWGSLEPETLAQWMIDNEFLCSLGAIYSLQIHKILKVL